MKKTIYLGIILTALLLAANSCSLYGGQTGPSSTNTPAVTGPTAGADTVNIANFSFTPSTLTVKKGATVTWINQDAAPHRIKSPDFNSQVMNRGDSFSFTFNQTGSFDYTCAIHPFMAGKIVVE